MAMSASYEWKILKWDKKNVQTKKQIICVLVIKFTTFIVIVLL